MQWNLKKMWPTIAASMLLTLNFTYADINDCATPDLARPDLPRPNLVKPTLTTPNLENCFSCLETNGMINPPGMPLTRNGWDFQISADALLWQLQEDSLLYAVESTTLSLPVGNDRVKQKYNWGFRVGLDYTLPHDNWDIAATWTHLISNRHGRSTATAGNVLRKPGLILSAATVGFTTASAKYHNRLEQISLNTGREFFVSKWVTLRPFFGLRADWLRQRLRASYSGIATNPTDIQATQRRNKWWGIGIESGLNTQWSFCGGFSVYGNVAGAIEYGLAKQTLSESGITNYSFKDSYRICRPVIDLQLGLGWDYNFCEDRFHLGLKLGWENHVYFNQSLLFGPTPVLGSAPLGDLTYQGWTLHANFDF
ncbi:Lpg1974 family pore-forming outer membrane protein [Candidatus Rhabdochlamydia sp. T3358]|uniref:Lpg1974 family pore-forming outer membrane protein n=1 Tax=Candidatus Rhabdochlamydia sp. T3358 TaxID=2099795 RepID=UPI0010BBBAED|nr:Lpg1974 family pore-forming outer membrane protein [Candidatus Rhabdochlamydia sp. T3358]VHO00711.1 Legionella pneumophila major outer membrane protein precursor [Candidatus Rhabdochlamydia sp. T3358]